MALRISLFALLIISSINCSPKKDQEQNITVFCAASLAPVIQKMKEAWEMENEIRIIINAASSGMLARQIENGAPADLYISANDTWMQYLVKRTKLKSKVISIATNRLVIATHKTNHLDTLDILQLPAQLKAKSERVVIGDPSHVPLGKYTLKCLEYYRVYDQQTSSYIVAKDARNALRLTELKEATFGILYYSDAATSNHLKILTIIPDDSHQPINYSAITIDEENSAAANFLSFITSNNSNKIWEEYGFPR